MESMPLYHPLEKQVGGKPSGLLAWEIVGNNTQDHTLTIPQINFALPGMSY